jgi:hypothetical protein
MLHSNVIWVNDSATVTTSYQSLTRTDCLCYDYATIAAIGSENLTLTIQFYDEDGNLDFTTDLAVTNSWQTFNLITSGRKISYSIAGAGTFTFTIFGVLRNN